MFDIKGAGIRDLKKRMEETRNAYFSTLSDIEVKCTV
jgi:hypothetical protein